MATEITVISDKWYSQLKNGVAFDQNTSDYTPNIAGCVGERIKNVRQIDILTRSSSSVYNAFTYTPSEKKLVRDTGNWMTEGFGIGDTVQIYYTDNVGVVHGAYNGTISAMNETTLIFSADPGMPASAFTIMTCTVTTALTALVYKFGLVDNDASFSAESLMTGSEQVYYAGSIGTGSPRSTGWVNMTALGTINDWETGSARVKYVSTTGNTQRFEIEHTFIINPFWIDGQKTNFETATPPQLFAGESTLKYVCQVDFRSSLSNPNTAKVATIDFIKGSIGWFNENFNGFNNGYAIDSVVYNTYDALNPADETEVVITVSGRTFGAEKVSLSFFNLTELEDYTDTETNMETNLLYDNAIFTVGTPYTGANIIKSVSAVTGTGTIVITASLSFSTAQQLRISEGDQYALCVMVENSALTPGNSDRVNLLADVRTYDKSADIADLIGVEDYGFIQHNQETSETGTTDVRSWIEDTLYYKFRFWLDLSKDARLDQLSIALIAYNELTENHFKLNEFQLNLSDVVISDGIQQIEISTTRKYPYFNQVTVETAELSGDKQCYDVICSLKISWQDWVAQLDADTIFYQAGQLNNGLNKKASNYSGLENYDVRVGIFANVYGTDSVLDYSGNTEYLIISPILDIKNYSDPTAIAGTVTTYNPDTMVSLEGKIRKDGDTLFICEWTKPGGFSDITNFWAIHRIEEYRQNGESLYELSSLRTIENNLLKPISGQSKLKMSLITGKIYTECLIDYTKLGDGQYSLSARIDDGSDSPLPLETMITEDYIILQTEDSQNFIIESCSPLPLETMITEDYIILQTEDSQNFIIES